MSGKLPDAGMRTANPSGLQAAYDGLQLDYGAALAGEANQDHVESERAILAEGDANGAMVVPLAFRAVA